MDQFSTDFITFLQSKGWYDAAMSDDEVVFFSYEGEGYFYMITDNGQTPDYLSIMTVPYHIPDSAVDFFCKLAVKLNNLHDKTTIGIFAKQFAQGIDDNLLYYQFTVPKALMTNYELAVQIGCQALQETQRDFDAEVNRYIDLEHSSGDQWIFLNEPKENKHGHCCGDHHHGEGECCGGHHHGEGECCGGHHHDEEGESHCCCHHNEQ